MIRISRERIYYRYQYTGHGQRSLLLLLPSSPPSVRVRTPFESIWKITLTLGFDDSSRIYQEMRAQDLSCVFRPFCLLFYRPSSLHCLFLRT